MKFYDYSKAAKIIAANAKNLKTASLGMGEDWSWTATEVWRNGEYVKPLFEGDVEASHKDMLAEMKFRLEGLVGGVKRIVAREEVRSKYSHELTGLCGSGWATPRLHLEFLDGREEMHDCYFGESVSAAPADIGLGVLSQPCQDRIDAIPVIS